MRGWVSRRRLAEVLVTAAAALLVAGVLIGTHLRPDHVDASNGLTWLGEPDRGEVVQVNPATGRPETRLAVASPGDDLSVAQTESLLVVTDNTSGVVSVIDIATLTTGGHHQGRPDNTLVLLHQGDLYVVDCARGRIMRLDPGTAQIVGSVWTAGQALADAAVDGTGTVWALDVAGALHQLTWSDNEGQLVDAAAVRTVDGTGADSALVPHDRGVTVVAPESGRLIQVGTDRDATVATPLGETVAAAGDSPANLVAVSSTDEGTVTVLTDSATAHTVDAQDSQCAHPGKPVVHHDEVWVPCDGAILVLDRNGHVQRRIEIPAGTAEVITNDDVLYICSGDKCQYVDDKGDLHDLDTHGDGVPVQTPAPSSSRPQGPKHTDTPKNPINPVVTTPATTTSAPPPPPPPPPAPRPQNGDTVVTGVPGTLHVDTDYRWREYSATLAPPTVWQSFGGTCTLQVLGTGSLAQSLTIGCSATTAYLGVGDGDSYTVSVKACDGQGCVTSNSFSVTTIAPVDIIRDPPPCKGCQIP
jgi:hypothetical protein